MKKKLVLAFLLAGTLSMSSVAYASEGGQTLGEVTKETVEAPEAVAAESRKLRAGDDGERGGDDGRSGCGNY